MQVKDKLKNIAVKRDLDFNTLLRLYMYDRFIERLAVSKYRDNFILKGGFYLSTLFGLENRLQKIWILQLKMLISLEKILKR